MDMQGKVAMVTGAGSGIGAAIAQAMAQAGARGVVVADLDLERAQAVAAGIGAQALALRCDVAAEPQIQAAVQATRDRFGALDVYVSNAGILGQPGGFELDDALWERMWRIHGMAHVWAARAVVPDMVARGEGAFVVTASAAGLLNIVETAPYGVTKHAAVAFAEWLRIAYGRRGLRVACLCPQAVDTQMLAEGAGSAGIDGVLPPQEVARVLIDTLREERFLALPHPQVLQYLQAKTADYDRWIGGMQKLHQRHSGTAG